MSGAGLSDLACWLLRRLVPPHWRDSIEGDLLEERRRRHHAGRGTGWAWQLCAVLAIGVRLAVAARVTQIVPSGAPAARRGWAESLGADIRFAARALDANRVYAGLAVATLALSIGANTAIVNIANWLLFRPLPGVDRPADLVGVRFKLPSPDSTTPVSLDEVDAIAKSAPALEGLTGFMGVPMSVTMGTGTTGRRVPIEFVMANYFDVLHAPIFGRGFTAEEERAPNGAPVVVIGYTLAQREFPGQSPLGKTLMINGISTLVIGVTPETFRGTRLMAAIDLWMPIAQRYVALPGPPARPPVESGGAQTLFSLAGRLAPHQTREVLQQQLDALDRRLAAEPATSARYEKSDFYALSHLEFYGPARSTLVEIFGVLMAAAALLLLLACANVGNAMLGRTLSRSGEIATRLALGASRAQIARLLLAESMLLSAAAALLAVGAAQLTATVLEGTVLMPVLPPLSRAALDWRVLGSAVTLSTVAAVAAGLSPMWAVRKIALAEVLQAAGRSMSRSRHRLRRGLMAVQVGVSVALLLVAGLLVRSIDARLAIDPGFDAAHVRTFSLDPRVPKERAMVTLHRDIVDRVRQVPGVRSASLSFFPPFYVGTEAQLQFHTDLSPENMRVALNAVRPGFFHTIGLTLVDGRDFTESDLTAGEHYSRTPLILSESVARRAFGTTAVAGRTVTSLTGARREVVGVVRQSRQRELTNSNTDDIAFQPYHRTYATPFITVVVAMSRPDGDAWPELRQAMADVDPSLVMFDARRAADGIRSGFGRDALAMRLAVMFGVLAVTLAATGLYAVLTRGFAERRREFGIRTALGATPARVAALVVRELSVVLPAGIVVGLLTGVMLARYLGQSLYSVSNVDPLSLGGAVGVVIAMMAIASIPVCRRAARVNAAEALKE